mmetsp:Transcript_30280/g.41660  ORF Transcript_30280/g.41660 Transcript_30280/m.41660 type:complete len:84 (-) Transcript_30280:289-540(-)
MDKDLTGISTAGMNSSLHLSASRSHIFTDPLWSPEINSAWHGCNMTELTGELHSYFLEQVFDLESQIRTVPSSDPVYSHFWSF